MTAGLLPRPLVIDAHVHLRGRKHVPASVMQRAGVRHMVNINYMSEGDAARTRAFGTDLDSDTEDRGDDFLSCTTFPLAGFGEPGFADAAIAFLEDRFARHPQTVAIKIWKNVGLELRDAAGDLVQCDDQRFSPIFAWIEARGIPVYLHIGDPIAAWQPLDPTSPHYNYYSRNPRFYQFSRAGAPSCGTLIEAQDRLIARWPGIRFIGAHFAALAHDVALVGQFLARHPNAAVDSSARHNDIRHQDNAMVRALFLKFPHRILFGSDWSASFAQDSAADEDAAIVRQCGQLAWDHGYFARDLALPDSVLDLFYGGNARTWLGLDARLAAAAA